MVLAVSAVVAALSEAPGQRVHFTFLSCSNRKIHTVLGHPNAVSYLSLLTADTGVRCDTD